MNDILNFKVAMTLGELVLSNLKQETELEILRQKVKEYEQRHSNNPDNELGDNQESE